MMQKEIELEWCDVEDAAKVMFHTWIESGEVEWVRECWEYSRRCGLTRAGDVIQETAAKVRLLKWDEGYDEANRDVRYLAECLELNPIALGVLAASNDLTALDGVDDNTKFEEYVHLCAIRNVRSEIQCCLCQAYGDAALLYARMCLTTKTLDVGQNEADDFDADGQNLQAYNFVQNGFQY